MSALKEAIQMMADAAYETFDDEAIGAALALGTPGDHIEVAPGNRQTTGNGWGNGRTFEVLADGIELWLEEQGSPAAITAKLNELITQFNQLLDDYDNAVVPTLAQQVTLFGEE